MSTINRSKLLEEASRLLSPYVELSGRHALISTLLEGNTTVINAAGEKQVVNTDNAFTQYAMKLTEMVDGGVSMYDFLQDLKNFATTNESDKRKDDSLKKIPDLVKKFIRISEWQGNGLEPTGGNSFRGDSDLGSFFNSANLYGLQDEVNLTLPAGGIYDMYSPVAGLYAIELLNPRLGLSGRDTPSVSIFTSLISPVEISRCVPFVEVKIKQTIASTGSDGEATYSGLSLLSYLNGSSTKPKKGLDTFISFPESNGIPGMTGMELFTAPQTLAPMKDSAALSTRENGGQSGALDRFRPFMSLKSLNITVTPTKGSFSHMSGKMELILHDRSRLHEIAALVRPGLYTSLELDIQYGWMHPFTAVGDEIKRNAIGAFLNTQRRRNRWGVTSVSFNMDETGQIHITLNIFENGYNDFKTINISSVQGEKAVVAIKKAMEDLSGILKSDDGEKSKRFQELFGDVVMTAAGSTSSAISLNEQKLKDLKDSLKKAKEKGLPSEASSIVVALEGLYGNDGGQGAVEEFRKSAYGKVSGDLNLLTRGYEIFPFHDSIINENEKANLFKNKTVKFETYVGQEVEIQDSISLGRVIMNFIGKPLIKTGRYFNVHILFYTFNSKASFMRDLCISKFPIPKKFLLHEIYELMKTNLEITIEDFVVMLNSKFVGNVTSHAYGYRSLYEFEQVEYDTTEKQYAGEAGGTSESSVSSKRKDSSQVPANAEDFITKKAGINDGVFRLPKLCVMPECVPLKTNENESVLRLHVFDETATNESFATIVDLLQAANSVDIQSFGFTNEFEHPTLKKAPELNSIDKKKQVDMSVDIINNLLIKNPTTSSQTNNDPEINISNIVWGIKSVKDVKRFISQNVPTIRYGRTTGMINNISMQSNTDPKLNNINITRMFTNDAMSPEVVQNIGLPMMIHPTDCTIDMLGCPLLAYGQQFFLDFDTGTSADNMYYVTNIDHKIEPGSFTTSAKLTFVDAYSKYISQRKKIKTTSAYLRDKFKIQIPSGLEDEQNENVNQAAGTSTAVETVGTSAGGTSAGERKWRVNKLQNSNQELWISGDKKPISDPSFDAVIPKHGGTYTVFGQARRYVDPTVIDPKTGKGKITKSYFHTGQDIPTPIGNPVYTLLDGEVYLVRRNSKSAGDYVEILSNLGGSGLYLMRYMHLSKILVEKGQKVYSGKDPTRSRTQIGLSGNAGNSTGPHLHLEVLTQDKSKASKSMTGEDIPPLKLDGQTWYYVNPYDFMSKTLKEIEQKQREQQTQPATPAVASTTTTTTTTTKTTQSSPNVTFEPRGKA